MENDEPPDTEFRNAMGLDDGALGWEDLLAKRRVVILAEAGSGKSTELAERYRLVAANRQFSFLATVQDVGQDGRPICFLATMQPWQPGGRHQMSAASSTF